jgi:hypothetical protein
MAIEKHTWCDCIRGQNAIRPKAVGCREMGGNRRTAAALTEGALRGDSVYSPERCGLCCNRKALRGGSVTALILGI